MTDASDRPTVELKRLREDIERIDHDLIRLMAERVTLARAAGGIKRAAQMPTLDPAREAAIVRRAASLARDAGLDEQDVRRIFWHIIGLARRAQMEA